MNFFIATCTTIILATSFIANKHVGNEGEVPLKIEIAKKYTAIDKTVKPHVSTIIPASMVEEKYIAKTTAANGDTIRYVPYFVERKIKH